jgi:hypothetical protein
MQRIDPILGIIICRYQWRRSDVDALIEEPGEADNAAPDNAVPGNVVPATWYRTNIVPGNGVRSCGIGSAVSTVIHGAG